MDSAGKSSAKFHSQSLVGSGASLGASSQMLGGVAACSLGLYLLSPPKGNLFITGSKSENTAIIKQLLKYQQPLKSLI